MYAKKQQYIVSARVCIIYSLINFEDKHMGPLCNQHDWLAFYVCKTIVTFSNFAYWFIIMCICNFSSGRPIYCSVYIYDLIFRGISLINATNVMFWKPHLKSEMDKDYVAAAYRYNSIVLSDVLTWLAPFKQTYEVSINLCTGPTYKIIGPWVFWKEFYISNCEAKFNYWWPRYPLWTRSQMNVIGPYIW